MIDGNVRAKLQIQQNSKDNIAGVVKEWQDLINLPDGFLDFVGGDASYKPNYKGKVKETTHVFICDYVEIKKGATKCRMVVDCGVYYETYDVLLIDDPMGLHQHLEILLKYNEVIQ